MHQTNDVHNRNLGNVTILLGKLQCHFFSEILNGYIVFEPRIFTLNCLVLAQKES